MWLDRALLYLGVGSGDADEGMKQLFDSCREEIEEKIHPRFLHERCRLSHLPLASMIFRCHWHIRSWNSCLPDAGNAKSWQ